MKLIGLTGFAGAGKDAVAGFLTREHGFTRVAFADPLRDMLYALNPVVDMADGEAVRVQRLVDSLGWDYAKREYPEVRRLLQRLGTEAGREVLGQNVWVDLGLHRAREAGGAVVITDVRFDNEVEAVRAAGGALWRVDRPHYGQINGHASDTALSGVPVDRVILNDGSLSDLGYAVFGAVTCA